MAPIDTRTLIKLGAERRIEQLQAEIATLQDIINETGGTPQPGELVIPDLPPATSDDRPARTPRLHWTQRPENADKLIAMHRKAARTRKARQ